MYSSLRCLVSDQTLCLLALRTTLRKRLAGSRRPYFDVKTTVSSQGPYIHKVIEILIPCRHEQTVRACLHCSEDFVASRPANEARFSTKWCHNMWFPSEWAVH